MGLLRKGSREQASKTSKIKRDFELFAVFAIQKADSNSDFDPEIMITMLLAIAATADKNLPKYEKCGKILNHNILVWCRIPQRGGIPDCEGWEISSSQKAEIGEGWRKTLPENGL